jgi:hypothetical protein
MDGADDPRDTQPEHEPGADPDPDEGDEELEEWDEDSLPQIWNAESLDDAELGLLQVLALRFRGEGIGIRGANLRLFAELLQSLHRVLTGLQPVAAGLRVELEGPLPRLPGVDAPLLQGAVAGHSITLVLGLAGEEAKLMRRIGDPQEIRRLEEAAALPEPLVVGEQPTKHEVADFEEVEWAAQFPTLKAAHWMTEVLSAEPQEAVQRIHRLGRRAARDYLKMTDVLASHELDTFVRGHDRPEIAFPSDRSSATSRELRSTEQRSETRLSVRGALYQADAKNHKFRLITDTGESIRGDYLPDMLETVRGAWAKVVRAEIVRTEYRWVGAERPHRTTYHLEGVPRVFEDADEFLAEEG